MVEITQHALDGTGALAGAGEESRGQTTGGGGGAGGNHTVAGGTEGTTGSGGPLEEKERRGYNKLGNQVDYVITLNLYTKFRKLIRCMRKNAFST